MGGWVVRANGWVGGKPRLVMPPSPLHHGRVHHVLPRFPCKPTHPCMHPPTPPSQAGHNLATMQSVSDMYSARNVLVLLLAGALALVPVLLRRLRRTDRAARHFHPAGLPAAAAAHAGQAVGGKTSAPPSAGGTPRSGTATPKGLLPIISHTGVHPSSARPGGGGATGLASVVVVPLTGSGGGAKRLAGVGVAPPPPPCAKHLSEAAHIL